MDKLQNKTHSAMQYIDLKQHESKTFSQNGEDGVLEKIFEMIGTTNKYYVEFGVESASECNTRLLKEKHEWTGLLMDGGYENHSINLHKEFITAENINTLFVKYKVPLEFDLLSIDIDFADFHVWKAISTDFQPRVIIVEYNAEHKPPDDKVCKYDKSGVWDGSVYFGASICAFQKLGFQKNYSLVYAEQKGVNLFFIRKDVLENLAKQNLGFSNTDDCEKIYNCPNYGNGPNHGHYADKQNRSYTSFEELNKDDNKC